MMDKEFIMLSVEDILELHSIQIEEFGGKDGLFPDSKERIEGIINQIYPIFGVENYETVLEKIVAMTYFIVKDHCFQDGNKRVALTVCSVLLYLNGFELHFTEEEAYDFIYDMASMNVNNINIKEIVTNKANFLRENVLKVR